MNTKILYRLFASALFALALFDLSTTSSVFNFQPEVPKSLKL